jgi:hypothetical protein
MTLFHTKRLRYFASSTTAVDGNYGNASKDSGFWELMANGQNVLIL